MSLQSYIDLNFDNVLNKIQTASLFDTLNDVTKLDTSGDTLSQIGISSLSSISSGAVSVSQISPLDYNGDTATPVLPNQIGSGVYEAEEFIVGTSGKIRSGQTDYNTGIGWWIGDVAGTKKLSIGNPATDYFLWTGTGIQMSGTVVIVAGSISIGTDPNAFHVDSNGNMWLGASTYATAPFGSTNAGAMKATLGVIAGWNIIDGYLYNLQSGTPTSSPNDGIVMASGNEGIICYEDTAKRCELGYLSSGVYGLKGYATNGTDVIFELSDTQQKIAGFYFTDTVLRSNTTDASSNIFLDSANSLIRAGATTGNYLTLDGASLRLRSSNYVSGFAGAGFTLEPNLLEVGNIACRGLLRTYVLQKDIISVNAGSLLVAPNADVLDTDMTALDASTLTIKGTVTFAAGDLLRIKDGTDDEWIEVTNIASAPTYTVTRDKAGAYGADANPTWKKGATVANYGQSGDGGLYLTASDTNNPYLSVYTHAGSPWTTITTQLRLGNLNGYLDYVSDIYGLGVGSSSGTIANLTIDPTNGFRLRKGTTNMISLDNSGVAYFANAITIGDGTNYSGTLTLNHADTKGDTYIAGGTVTASTWTCNSGFLMGIDDSDSNKVKFYLGDATTWIDWNVTTANTLTVSGTITVGSFPNLPSDANLAGYWAFNENSGSVAYDNSKNGNNGTCSNTTIVAGIYGNALSFNGTTSYVQITDNAAIQNIWDGGGTISVWIYPTGFGEDGRILSKHNAGYTAGWFFGLSGDSGTTANLQFAQYFSTASCGGNSTEKVITYNTWNHIVIKYNSDSSSNVVTVYVNGVEVAWTTSVGGAGTRATDVGQDFYIGNSAATSSTFLGYIDEVRLYKTTTLTSNEGRALFLNPAGSGQTLISGTGITTTNLAAINTNTGALTVSGALTVGTSGSIGSGQTAYNTGTGFWWEYNAGTPRMSIGNGSTKTFTYDGTDIALVGGTMTAGTFQTSASANTGIKMDTTSLRGYDAGNNEVFSLSPSTGIVTATAAKISSLYFFECQVNLTSAPTLWQVTSKYATSPSYYYFSDPTNNVIKRLEKQSYGNYAYTGVNVAMKGGICHLGSYVYCTTSPQRYAEDLTGASALTISGTDRYTGATYLCTDGTNIYTWTAGTGTDKIDKYTLSGTTLTWDSQITLSVDPGTITGLWCDGTYFYTTLANTIRIYSLAGTQQSSNTRYIQYGTGGVVGGIVSLGLEKATVSGYQYDTGAGNQSYFLKFNVVNL